MRIALLVTDHERGGTPLRLARLARLLAGAGVEVHAGCLAARGPVTATCEQAGISTFTCEAGHAGDLPALGRLARHLRDIRPDLVHATLMHANVAARICGFLQRVPVIGSTATIELERPWHRAAERATSGVDRAHIVNSAAVAEYVTRVLGVPARRVHIVPPSLDPWPARRDYADARAALGIPPDEFVVAWQGRLDPVKRLDLLVQTAELMTPVSSRFLIIGDGPARPALERLLRHSPARSAVHLMGWRDEPAAVLSAADAFLFPSRTEGMPNAVLEAMALGLPIVAADIPVLRELAGNGRRICLADGDAPHDFAEILLRWRTDEAERRRIGACAAAWARDYLDPQRTRAAVLRVYRHVLRQGARRTSKV